MPDITMCSGKRDGEICCQRDKCFRFTAVASRRQSFFVIAPFIGDKCSHFKLDWNFDKKEEVKPQKVVHI